MKTMVSLFALLVAVVAIVVAVINKTPEAAAPSNTDARFDALEAQVARLSQAVMEMREERDTPPPLASGSRPGEADTLSPTAIGKEADANAEDRLKAMVSEAVDLKTKEVVEELENKDDKNPSLDVFAATLELTDEQRRAAEQEVIRGQREVFDILDIPTEGGANLMDELVEVVARSVAWPEKDPGWGKWLVRVITEKIPGTDETYATRIDAVKATVLDSFKRTFNEEQYAEFQKWGVDPIEIQDIPDSPGEDLESRYMDRARQLTAEFPDGPPKSPSQSSTMIQ